jgi:hypothetical protein
MKIGTPTSTPPGPTSSFQGIDQRNEDCGLERSEEAEGVNGLAVARRGVRMRLRYGLRLGLVNCRCSSRRSDAGDRSGHSKTFQDIASAHAFIIGHDFLPG